MRKILVLLTVLLASQTLLAIKPAKKGASLDDSMTYINKTLYPTMDYFYGCSEKIEVTLSEQHQEIIITHLPVDGGGKVKKDLPPMYIYRIPVADVKSIYPWGYSPYIRYNRLVIRTNGRAVSKYGPYWDCFHRRMSKKTKLRLLDNAMLKLDDLDDSQLIKLINAFKRTVELTRMESAEAIQKPDAETTQQPPAASADQTLDDDEGVDY